MDPQLRAVRQAAHERFLAEQQKQRMGVEAAEPAAVPAAAVPESAAAAGSGSPALAGAASVLHGLPAEALDAPIAALLADGPALAPPAKRKRAEGDPGSLRVPREQTDEIRRLLALPAPSEVRLLSWNIDGLDEVGGPRGLMLRVLAVALQVARQRPAAILLQEAVPPALELLAAEQVLGGAYEVLVPEDPPLPYYVAILLDRKRARQLGQPQTVSFPSSEMGRQLLAVAVELPGGGPPVLLATAHLESTKDSAAERKRQLAQSLRYLRAAVGQPPAGVLAGSKEVGAALLGGDLNLRDEEVKAVWRELGDTAKGIADAWVFCGSPDNARWTWDTVTNNNLGATYSCRTRFDRIFFLSPGISDMSGAGGRSRASAKGKAAAKPRAKAGTSIAAAVETPSPIGWRPTAFALVGRERVPSLGRFPSDHWGMLTAWAASGSAASAGVAAPPPEAAAAPRLAAAASSPPAARSEEASEQGTAAEPSAGGAPTKLAAGDGKLPLVKPGRVLIDLDD